jgi:hypothetical protein
VKIISRHPAGTDQIKGQIAQLFFNLPREIEGYEEAHGAAAFGRDEITIRLKILQ